LVKKTGEQFKFTTNSWFYYVGPRGINKTGLYELFNINEIWMLGAQMSEY